MRKNFLIESQKKYLPISCRFDKAMIESDFQIVYKQGYEKVFGELRRFFALISLSSATYICIYKSSRSDFAPIYNVSNIK